MKKELIKKIRKLKKDNPHHCMRKKETLSEKMILSLPRRIRGGVFRMIKKIRVFIGGLKSKKRLLKDFYRIMREFPYFNMTPIELHLFSNSVFRSTGHYDWTYKEWRMKRINKVLDIFGVDYFVDKKILVLGDGLGHIGAFFADIGAKVLSVEGKRQNVNIAKLKYRNLKNFKIIEFDLRNDFTHLGKFDLIINFGLIEVMDEEGIQNLLECCVKMSNKVLVDTIVLDSLDSEEKFEIERGKESDSGLPSRSERSSTTTLLPQSCIESFFEEKGFETRRFFDSDLNSTDIRYYDWNHGIKIKKKDSLRRFWLFERKLKKKNDRNKS
ncbi:hypothetical protein LCGC14_0737800 [marine sediment metagenome]|uniref:Methyltransferase domain-containing protein n=1 Tax=marine sediment metagenome TaxID=412755 RepID=A0A0F9QBT3_9ZZZZ